MNGREAGDDDIEPDFLANATYNIPVLALSALCVIVWAVMAFLIFAFSDLCVICCHVVRAVMVFLNACRRVIFNHTGCSAAVVAFLKACRRVTSNNIVFSAAVVAFWALDGLLGSMYKPGRSISTSDNEIEFDWPILHPLTHTIDYQREFVSSRLVTACFALDGLIAWAVAAFLNVCRHVTFYKYINGSAEIVTFVGLVGLPGERVYAGNTHLHWRSPNRIPWADSHPCHQLLEMVQVVVGSSRGLPGTRWGCCLGNRGVPESLLRCNVLQYNIGCSAAVMAFLVVVGLLGSVLPERLTSAGNQVPAFNGNSFLAG